MADSTWDSGNEENLIFSHASFSTLNRGKGSLVRASFWLLAYGLVIDIFNSLIQQLAKDKKELYKTRMTRWISDSMRERCMST